MRYNGGITIKSGDNIIHFKNGKTKAVSKEIADKIKDNLIKGCDKLQSFSDGNGNLILIVNLDEVVYID